MSQTNRTKKPRQVPAVPAIHLTIATRAPRPELASLLIDKFVRLHPVPGDLLDGRFQNSIRQADGFGGIRKGIDLAERNTALYRSGQKQWHNDSNR